MNQKFQMGDLVKIGDCGPTMWHFEQNCLAIVTASYRELCGGTESNGPYQVIILPDGYHVSWYPESVLTLIKRGHAQFDRMIPYSVGLKVVS